jgi:hypothetical protein
MHRALENHPVVFLRALVQITAVAVRADMNMLFVHRVL